MRLPHVICLLLCLGGIADASARPIRIGIENNSAPMSFLDEHGHPAGFTTDLLQAMEKSGHLDIEVESSYWLEILTDFQEGRLDALANVTITPERRATMDFSISHAYVHGLMYYRQGSPALTRTAEFAGKTIGTLKGSIGHMNALAHGGWGATIVAYDKWQQALDDTRDGKIDGALFIRSPSSSVRAETSGLKYAFVDDVVHVYHFAVHKGDARTLERINEALATVRANGAFDRIYAKWIGPMEPHPIRLADLTPYYLPAALVVLALAGVFLWQRHILGRLARQAAALRASEERWKFALEGAGDGVWDWNVQTNEVVRSKRWKAMLGYADHEVGLGRDEGPDRVHPDDLAEVQAAQEPHLRGETPSFSVEHRMRCKDGSWKWVLNRGMVVSRDADGRPQRIIGTLTDLTARKQAEDDRLVLGKLESTGVLAGGIAHDFNNLLTAMLLNLDMARYHSDSAAEMLPRIEAAEKAALAARSLTQQLITFARGDASVVRLTDIAHLLETSMPLALSGSSVRGELQVASDLWNAEVDGGQIGQVIRNLVLNAREAMPDGGVVTLAAANVHLLSNQVQTLPEGDYLHIRVADEGEGIAPEKLAKIFDPYFSTKQRGPQKGMGLGLTICHAVMRKHQGAITVESTIGRGTTFHLYLPAADVKLPPRPDSTPPLPERVTVPRRILAMDDEPVMRDAVQQTLREMGFDCEVTPDGEATVACYQRAREDGRPFETVLVDLTIPGGMGGRDTLMKLREIDPAVVVIVMSGYTHDKAMSDYQAVGFNAALPKPFTSAMLRDALAQVGLVSSESIGAGPGPNRVAKPAAKAAGNPS